MFDLLNSYLFQNKSISIPGLGTIYLETLPASVDISTKNILPPLYYFRFDKYFDAPDKEFFSYLANHRRIPDYEALKWYNEFAFNLRNRIHQLEKIEWEGVGVLRKDLEGNILFESCLGNPFFLMAVPARQVIRQDAQHRLLVGDRERTSGEMNEWLQHENASRKSGSWWIYAAIVAALSLLFLFLYFSSKGWTMSSLGNQQMLQLEK
jgi:hypothetical protein